MVKTLRFHCRGDVLSLVKKLRSSRAGQWVQLKQNECIWVSSSEADELRTYFTEWSESEREKQISYISACTWNLKRWCWLNYLQGRNGDADIKNRLVDTVGKERVGRSGRAALKHTHQHMENSQPAGICSLTQGAQTCGSVTNQTGGTWREAGGRSKREGTYV